MKHNSEPWRSQIAGQHSWQVLAHSQPGIVGARAVVQHTSHADADRIVACVNACEGLTEAELGRFIDVATALRAENQRLREALEGVTRTLEAFSYTTTLGKTQKARLEAARAALGDK